MKLYNYFRSSASFRVRIALELKGLSYEYVPVDLRINEHEMEPFRSISPSRLVPVLEDDGATVNQSLAIVEYLEETHPQVPLLPTQPQGRAQVRALALMVACDIHPLNNLRVLKYLSSALHIDSDTSTRWYRHWVRTGLEAYEVALRDSPAGIYSYGDTPTLADCCLVPQIFNGQRYGADFSGLTRTMSVFENCMRNPAFVRASPASCPDQ